MRAYELHIQSMTNEELEAMVKDCGEKKEVNPSPTFQKAMNGLIEKCNTKLREREISSIATHI